MNRLVCLYSRIGKMLSMWRRQVVIAVVMGPRLEADQGPGCAAPGCPTGAGPVEELLHPRPGLKQWVAGVFRMVDRVGVAESAVFLLLEVQER